MCKDKDLELWDELEEVFHDDDPPKEGEIDISDIMKEEK